MLEAVEKKMDCVILFSLLKHHIHVFFIYFFMIHPYVYTDVGCVGITNLTHFISNRAKLKTDLTFMSEFSNLID